MRTALVGGASSGLGLACAQALARRGWTIVMCARRSGPLEEAARSIERHCAATAFPIACDWSDRSSLERLASELEARSLRIDVLVNNVGGPPPGRATQLSEADWEVGLDQLFRSTLRIYGLVLPGMRERGWGRIVNILSTAAVEPVPTLAISSVLRDGLAAYAKLVAHDVARDGVTINSVMPGPFRTARTIALETEAARSRNLPVAAIQQESVAQSPMGRLLDPHELGGLVAFLASDEASGITGALVPVDGGLIRSV